MIKQYLVKKDFPGFEKNQVITFEFEQFESSDAGKLVYHRGFGLLKGEKGLYVKYPIKLLIELKYIVEVNI